MIEILKVVRRCIASHTVATRRTEESVTLAECETGVLLTTCRWREISWTGEDPPNVQNLPMYANNPGPRLSSSRLGRRNFRSPLLARRDLLAEDRPRSSCRGPNISFLLTYTTLSILLCAKHIWTRANHGSIMGPRPCTNNLPRLAHTSHSSLETHQDLKRDFHFAHRLLRLRNPTMPSQPSFTQWSPPNNVHSIHEDGCPDLVPPACFYINR